MTAPQSCCFFVQLVEKVAKYADPGGRFEQHAAHVVLGVQYALAARRQPCVVEAEFPLERRAVRVACIWGQCIVGQQVVVEDGRRYLVVRGEIDGSGLPLKTGMLGRAKIETGPRSIGYVFLRKPARFIWRKTWSWLP